jgi:mRNA interferase HigB
VEGADFGGPQDLKQMFGASVDFVGQQIVFDVGGNKIRTISKVTFGQRIILVTHVLTHAEYDKNKWKE